MTRQKIIIANWKMYKTISEAKEYARSLKKMLLSSSDKISDTKIYIAAPFTAIHPLAVELQDLQNSALEIGAQNMNDVSEGAFTGEIAGKMLRDAGAKFVILGHSERRRFFHETNKSIQLKIKRALEEGLQPILCVGESLEQREGGEVESTLETQLKECLEGIHPQNIVKLAIAYEPVWAIGTGKCATPETAQAAHHTCRSVLADLTDWESANSMSILYGGSVKKEGVPDLMQQPDVDGLLVGSASLNAHEFWSIIEQMFTENFLEEK